jgi:hypothetical protein
VTIQRGASILQISFNVVLQFFTQASLKKGVKVMAAFDGGSDYYKGCGPGFIF